MGYRNEKTPPWLKKTSVTVGAFSEAPLWGQGLEIFGIVGDLFTFCRR